MLKDKFEKYLFAVGAGLFIYMPFHVFLSQWLSTYTGGLETWKVLKDVITALVTILFIVTVLIYKKSTSLYKKLLILIAVYGLIHIIIGFATNQPKTTFLLAIVYNLRIFCYLLIGYSMVLIRPKDGLFYKYRRLLLVLSTIVCFLAIIQWILPKDLLTHFGYSVARGVKPNFFIDDKPDLPRAFSTLRDPNSLGAFLIVPIVILFQSLIINWKNSKRTSLAGLFALHVWILFLTFSRSTLLATIFALIVLLVIQKSNLIIKHKTWIISGVTILFIVSLGFVYSFRHQYFVQNTVFHADESTRLETPNALRKDLAHKAINGIVNKPLGHGPGTAGLVSTRLKDGLLTENYYLQILYEVGIFGFLVFCALLFLILKHFWQTKNLLSSKMLIASFAGILFACLFFHTLSNEAISISAFMLAGLSFKK